MFISLSSRIPGKTYMIIAFLTVGTMGLSNTSLGYLNYPTQVIFKCCKLIPVMIGGVFIQGKLNQPYICNYIFLFWAFFLYIILILCTIYLRCAALSLCVDSSSLFKPPASSV